MPIRLGRDKRAQSNTSKNKASVMAHSPPTALEPVTNTSLSKWDECFVNLIVWLTVGAKYLATGPKREAFLNTHFETNILSHFLPLEGPKLGQHGPKAN